MIKIKNYILVLKMVFSLGVLKSIAVERKVSSNKALARLEHMMATQRDLVEELRYSIVISDPKSAYKSSIHALCLIL